MCFQTVFFGEWSLVIPDVLIAIFRSNTVRCKCKKSVRQNQFVINKLVNRVNYHFIGYDFPSIRKMLMVNDSKIKLELYAKDYDANIIWKALLLQDGFFFTSSKHFPKNFLNGTNGFTKHSERVMPSSVSSSVCNVTVLCQSPRFSTN